MIKFLHDREIYTEVIRDLVPNAERQLLYRLPDWEYNLTAEMQRTADNLNFTA